MVAISTNSPIELRTDLPGLCGETASSRYFNMVSEVDQKYLGTFAKQTASTSPELSAALYKVLGLSTLLNRKLLRAVSQPYLPGS